LSLFLSEWYSAVLISTRNGSAANKLNEYSISTPKQAVTIEAIVRWETISGTFLLNSFTLQNPF